MSAYRRRGFRPGTLLIYGRWFVRLLLFILVLDLGYLMAIWPDWSRYTEGPIQQSNFIRSYIQQQAQHKDWPRLRWHPVPLRAISPHVLRAVIVAEDARFYSHSGIDLEALKEAFDTNVERKRFAYGGSTITQQTVKNIFLSASKNPLRKWHEMLLTLGMEHHLSKPRILELYLNLAEFGRGVFGVEAAARHYWGVSAANLTQHQAIELAATLSAPSGHNPRTRSRYFLRKVEKIARYY